MPSVIQAGSAAPLLFDRTTLLLALHPAPLGAAGRPGGLSGGWRWLNPLPDHRRKPSQSDLAIQVLGSLLRNGNHQAAVHQPIPMALQQTLLTKWTQGIGLDHRPGQPHGGFNLVDVLTTSTT